MKAAVATEVSSLIVEHLTEMRDDAQARHLLRFFKTAPGQYGEGDRFLGLKNPTTRAAVKLFRGEVSLPDIPPLLASQWHEVRLCGFLLLIELYNKACKAKDEVTVERIVSFYLDNLDRGNNWDLVDLVAPKILGDYIVSHPDKADILYRLADRTDSLWHQRVAMVSTWRLSQKGIFEHTFRLADRFMNHPHDLMHKAMGWMLREVGKRGGRDELLDYLDTNATRMPRTALRYAIEHLPAPLRQHYLGMRARRTERVSR